MANQPNDFVSNYPRGEYAGRQLDLQAFRALLTAYDRCSRLIVELGILNVILITMFALLREPMAPSFIGWAVITVVALATADSLTLPIEKSRQEKDDLAPRLRIGLALLAPLFLSIPLIIYQRRRITQEIQKYDRSLVHQLDSFRSSVLAMSLLPPVPVGPDAITQEQRL